MDVEFARRLGTDEVARLLGEKWQFVIVDEFVGADGQAEWDTAGVAMEYSDGTGVVAILMCVVEALPVHEFMRLVLHEIAHGIVEHEADHGPVWRAQFDELAAPYQ